MDSLTRFIELVRADLEKARSEHGALLSELKLRNRSFNGESITETLHDRRKRLKAVAFAMGADCQFGSGLDKALSEGRNDPTITPAIEAVQQARSDVVGRMQRYAVTLLPDDEAALDAAMIVLQSEIARCERRIKAAEAGMVEPIPTVKTSDAADAPIPELPIVWTGSAGGIESQRLMP